MANDEHRKEILEIRAWNWRWNKESEKPTSKERGIPVCGYNYSKNNSVSNSVESGNDRKGYESLEDLYMEFMEDK